MQTNGRQEPVTAMENCLKALEDEYGDMKEQFDVSCYRNRHPVHCKP